MGRIGIASLAASALLAVSGCGEGPSDQADRVEPEAWAADICSAMTDFVTFTQSRANQYLEESGGSFRSGEEAKTSAVALYTEVLGEADEMLRKIDAAGTPEGDEGAEFRRELRAVMGQVRPIFVRLRARARDLPTHDVNAFNSAARALGAETEREFVRWGNDIEDALGTFKGTFEGEKPEECRRLEATSSG
jgi:hypothetical protein